MNLNLEFRTISRWRNTYDLIRTLYPKNKHKTNGNEKKTPDFVWLRGLIYTVCPKIFFSHQTSMFIISNVAAAYSWTRARGVQLLPSRTKKETFQPFILLPQAMLTHVISQEDIRHVSHKSFFTFYITLLQLRPARISNRSQLWKPL